MPAPRRLDLCVAWSGGADSTALLALLVDLRDAGGEAGLLPPLRLRAVHVDHQLQPAAAQFVRACRRQARQWRVPLRVLRVDVARSRGRSPEDAAREARRRALSAALRSGEWLLQAQHADDQAETSLLQWLRGAGPAGLAGMPLRQAFGPGLLVRPLLDIPGEDLRQLLRQRGIPWVEDPSNQSERFDRNFLRQRVMPLLRARWPALPATAARSARLAASAAEAVARQGRRDAAAAADGEGLDLRRLRCLPAARRQEALRSWLRHLGAPAADERRVHAALALGEAPASAVVLQWDRVELRRDGERLLCCPRGRVADVAEAWRDSPLLRWEWRRLRPLALPGGGWLAWQADRWGPVDASRLPDLLACSAWEGGLKLGIGGRQRPVAELLRSAGIPAWERHGVPLLWDGDRLLAVADIAVDEAAGAGPGSQHRGRFVWQQH